MGKTVTTFLVDGDPQGTQYASISNKICQMFVIPRSNLAYLNEQSKLQKPAFYIHTGEDESTKPQAYIGETENFRERVKEQKNKNQPTKKEVSCQRSEMFRLQMKRRRRGPSPCV